MNASRHLQAPHNKLRLDELLCRRGFFATRESAERAVLARSVRSGDVIFTQPSLLVDLDTSFEVLPQKRFVSRGGEKLQKAFESFTLSPSALRCIDIGASTGGFTDCLLQNGASEVCAVDVCYGQFAWELRRDARVHLFERTNINTVDVATLGSPFDLAVVDVSFMRVARLVQKLADLLVDQGHCIILVKPQFELPKSLVTDGVIREQELHKQALRLVLEACTKYFLAPQNLTVSPIKGPKGNIEFLLWAQKDGIPVTILVDEHVQHAHDHFAK